MLLERRVLAWVTLARAPALDAPHLRAALDILGSAQAILDCIRRPRAAARESLRRRGIPARARRGAERRGARWLDDPRHHLVPFTDPRYPAAAASQAERPDRALCRRQRRGVERSAAGRRRQPQPHSAGTRYGASISRNISPSADWQSPAGSPQGIDSAAHRGALAAQGITLAVLGTGSM